MEYVIIAAIALAAGIGLGLSKKTQDEKKSWATPNQPFCGHNHPGMTTNPVTCTLEPKHAGVHEGTTTGGERLCWPNNDELKHSRLEVSVAKGRHVVIDGYVAKDNLQRRADAS